MTLRQKIEMADKMIKEGYISKESYNTLLKGFQLIEHDRINNLINRAK